MWENTIVLFFTDHGDMMGAHRFRRKGTIPYEELYNIPCIIRLPAGMERRRSAIDEPIISTDLGGALLDLAGIEAAGPFAASGVTKALGRDSAQGDEMVFFEHYAAHWGIHPFYGVRTASMKYVRYYGQENFEELYDLARDPDELLNLAGNPAYKAKQSQLSAAADAWWIRTGGCEAEYYESPEFKEDARI
jgi:arylsulfatase A-like enzyme